MSQLDLTAAVAAALAAFDEADQMWPEEVAHVGTAHVVNPRYLEGLAQQVLPLMAHRMLEAALPHLREQIAAEEWEKAARELRDEIADEIEERVDKCSGCNNWADAVAIVRGEATS